MTMIGYDEGDALVIMMAMMAMVMSYYEDLPICSAAPVVNKSFSICRENIWRPLLLLLLLLFERGLRKQEGGWSSKMVLFFQVQPE